VAHGRVHIELFIRVHCAPHIDNPAALHALGTRDVGALSLPVAAAAACLAHRLCRACRAHAAVDVQGRALSLLAASILLPAGAPCHLLAEESLPTCGRSAYPRGALVQGFLTAVLQAHARKHSVPLDTVWLGFKVTTFCTGDVIPAPPADGVYVDGLTVDAGRWDMDACCLAEPLPGILASALPVLHILPCHKDTPLLRPCAVYACPLYKTADRVGSVSTTGQSNNSVVVIDLPVRSSTHADSCVLQGVALLLCRK